jgi:hypothetical protein
VRAGRAALLLALATAACGGDPEPPKPTGPWKRARLPDVPLASGVAPVGRFLLVSSAQGSDVFVVRRDALVDGATVEARRLPIEVDRERPAHLYDEQAERPRDFRLGHLWDGPQRLSGVAVSRDSRPVVYLASEAYRVVFFGPLETDADGAPTRALLQRATEVPGARRTRSSDSDWQDYGGAPESGDGISGIAVDRDDLLVVERGRGQRQPGVWRIDRLSGDYRTRIGLSFSHERGDALWWSDVLAAEIGFLAPVVWTSPEGSAGNLLHVPKPRDSPPEQGVAARLWMPLDPSRPGETTEGIAVDGGEILAVRAATEGGSTVLWRKAP